MTDFTSVAKPSVDFTKPLHMQIFGGWVDVTYIGPYEGKHVVADSKGGYHTVNEYLLCNKPAKPNTKDVYNFCVKEALADGFGWASQETILDLLYGHLVLNGLIKKEK